MAYLFFGLAMTLFLGVIGWMFWEQEYKFSLPTPIPENLKAVHIGDSVNVSFAERDRLVYVYFFNYKCPCSRFNIKEFRSMVQ